MAAPNPASLSSGPAATLAPPKNTPFTLDQLKQFDGSDSGSPIYVAVKGTVFDVTPNGKVYGPGGSYHVFAGKDGSKGLGMSSTSAADAVPDWSGLTPAQVQVLDQWHSFFSQRYSVAGRVVG